MAVAGNPTPVPADLVLGALTWPSDTQDDTVLTELAVEQVQAEDAMARPRAPMTGRA